MPIIELVNASIFQNKKSVLENVNIQVAKGEFVFLIGRTGSGKSSLIKILYGDLPLKIGIGNVVGFDLLKITQKQIPFLRRKIGIVFQDFKLLSDRNIYDNLKFVLQATGWKNKDESYNQTGKWKKARARQKVLMNFLPMPDFKI